VFRTRVKICGITQLEDARSAADAGADALGFVFYDKSPRAVDGQNAAAIINRLPAFVTSVGLFVNAEQAFVEQTLKACQLDLLQFHGDEPPEYCEAFERPYIKALRMREGIDLHAQVERYHSARAILLDSYRPGVPGGTGERFDWDRIPEDLSLPVILAGGLNPENVGAGIEACHPWAVDVSGGVEAAPGRKSAAKVKQFLDAVNKAAMRE
jgi:phosphoribosylanthranilate isomerase